MKENKESKISKYQFFFSGVILTHFKTIFLINFPFAPYMTAIVSHCLLWFQNFYGALNKIKTLIAKIMKQGKERAREVEIDR